MHLRVAVKLVNLGRHSVHIGILEVNRLELDIMDRKQEYAISIGLRSNMPLVSQCSISLSLSYLLL